MNNEKEVILDARGLRRAFGATDVIQGVDISIVRGEVLALTGSTEAARSTLLALLSGHLDCDEGEILFEGVDVTQHPAVTRAELGLVRVFDASSLFEHLTVGDHVLAVARNSAPTSTDLYAQWQVDSQYLRRGLRSLGLAGLDVVIDTPIADLSLVQRRRLAFGLTALDPFDLVLWDQPFAELSADDEDSLRYLIDVQRQDGKSVLFSASDQDLPDRVADRVVSLG